MGKDAKEFERTLAPLRAQALNIGAAMSVVGGAVTTAFISMAKQAANYGDQIRDASIRTGISTQALSGLKFAAEQTGTSFEGVSTSLIRLSRNALAANQGTNQNSKAFAALGISVQDSSGHLRSQEQLLRDVADRFSTMKDGTEKAALAVQLFGRSGAQMTEFLNQGSAGLDAFQKRVQELGLEVGPEFAAMADQFNDATKEMEAAQLGLSVTIGSVVLPTLVTLTNLIIGAIIQFRKFTEAHPDLVRNVFALSAAIAGGGGLLVALAGVLFILPKLGAAFLLLTGPIGIAVLAVGALVSAMLAFPKFRTVVLDVLKDVASAVAFLGSYIASLGKTVLQLTTGQFSAAWQTFSTSVDRGFTAAADAANTFDGALNGIRDAMKYTAPPVMDLSKLMDGLGLDFDTATDKANTTRDTIRELNQAFIEQIRPADELSKKLQILRQRFDDKDIIRVYGDEIIESARKQREFGGTVDRTITALEKQSIVMNRAAAIIAANRESVLEQVKLPKSPDFLNVAPIVPPIDLSKDFEALDRTVQNLGNSTQETARKSAEMFQAIAKDQEAGISRAKKWEQAWATAVGNIASQFANTTVEGLFNLGGDKEKVESLERQITGIRQDAERQRLQNVIDGLKKTSGVRTKALADAEKQLADFDKRMESERDKDRQRQLEKLENDLAAQTNLFRRFANGVKNLFLELGKSIVKIMVTDAFTTIAKAFSDVVIKPLTEKLTGFLGSLGKAKALNVVGDTAAKSTVGGVASASGGVGGVASSAGSLTSGLISGGLAAAGSIVGALLTKGNAKRTEENTRESRDWLELQTNAWNPLFNQMVYYQKGIYESIRGGTDQRLIQSASTVVPVGATAPVTIEVTAPTTISLTVELERGDISDIEIRDQIAPKLLTEFDLGIRGHGEKIAQIVAKRLRGLTGTEVPIGI